MLPMNRVMALVAVLMTSGCSSSSSGALDGGTTDSASDSDQYACPISAQPQAPCDYRIPDCLGCSQGAGYWCTCKDAGGLPSQDGGAWLCVGTERACP